MLLFFYSLGLLVVAVVGKMAQTSPDYYIQNDLIWDLPLIVLNYFGLIGLWARMRKKKLGAWWFWQLYTLGLIVSTLLVPVFDDTVTQMIARFGVQKSLTSYAITVVFLLPYYIGLIDFAFIHRFAGKR